MDASRGQLTASLWVTTGEGERSCLEGQATSWFGGYSMTPHEAMRGDWAELTSLGEPHLAVVEALHARAEKGPCEVTADEAVVLARSPEKEEADAAALDGAIQRLARCRITWPSA